MLYVVLRQLHALKKHPTMRRMSISSESKKIKIQFETSLSIRKRRRKQLKALLKGLT
jgi:hypothetical protein